MGWIADLLKEIPSAARYKSELEAMEKQLVALMNKDAVSQATIQKLDAENVKLRQEIQRRDDVIQKEKSHDQRLPEIKESILVAMANGPTTDNDLTSLLGLSNQALRFHLEDGAMPSLVKRTNLGMVVSIDLTAAGRAHLAKQGML